MGLAKMAGASIVVVATVAVASPGDILVVTGDVVNVRSGPGADHSVLMHTYRDDQAVELGRSGDWVQVQIVSDAAEGWIHQSLLQVLRPAQPAAPETPPGQSSESAGAGDLPSAVAAAPSIPEDAASPWSNTEGLARFRTNVGELNDRAVAVAGVELFTGAEPVDGSTVQVMVTEAWDLMPAAGQTSYTNALFDRWRTAAGGAGELRLQIVDPSGAVVSEKSGPGTF
jgi:Bacterial SH3 domain